MLDVRPIHTCSSASFSVPLCCLDENGICSSFMHMYDIFYLLLLCVGHEHNILLVCCQCEPVVVTMVRARLWPATPQRPHLAFTFELLDWTEALLLECQVSVMDFCKALCFKCPHLVFKACVYQLPSACLTAYIYTFPFVAQGILFLFDRCI